LEVFHKIYGTKFIRVPYDEIKSASIVFSYSKFGHRLVAPDRHPLQKNSGTFLQWVFPFVPKKLLIIIMIIIINININKEKIHGHSVVGYGFWG
jgi:hypothetical protein